MLANKVETDDAVLPCSKQAYKLVFLSSSMLNSYTSLSKKFARVSCKPGSCLTI